MKARNWEPTGGAHLLKLRTMPTYPAPFYAARYVPGQVNAVAGLDGKDVPVMILTASDGGQLAVQFLKDDKPREIRSGEVRIIDPFNLVEG